MKFSAAICLVALVAVASAGECEDACGKLATEALSSPEGKQVRATAEGIAEQMTRVIESIAELEVSSSGAAKLAEAAKEAAKQTGSTVSKAETDLTEYQGKSIGKFFASGNEGTRQTTLDLAKQHDQSARRDAQNAADDAEAQGSVLASKEAAKAVLEKDSHEANTKINEFNKKIETAILKCIASCNKARSAAIELMNDEAEDQAGLKLGFYSVLDDKAKDAEMDECTKHSGKLAAEVAACCAAKDCGKPSTGAVACMKLQTLENYGHTNKCETASQTLRFKHTKAAFRHGSKL